MSKEVFHSDWVINANCETVYRGKSKTPEPPPPPQKPVLLPLPNVSHLKFSDALILKVCWRLNLNPHKLKSDCRTRHYVHGRALIAKLLRERNAHLYSYPRIAKIIGRKDHSTIINLARNWDAYVKLNPELALAYDELSGKDRVGHAD